jgi:uncharacterized protein (TIGR04222 family)
LIVLLVLMFIAAWLIARAIIHSETAGGSRARSAQPCPDLAPAEIAMLLGGTDDILNTVEVDLLARGVLHYNPQPKAASLAPWKRSWYAIESPLTRGSAPEVLTALETLALRRAIGPEGERAQYSTQVHELVAPIAEQFRCAGWMHYPTTIRWQRFKVLLAYGAPIALSVTRLLEPTNEPTALIWTTLLGTAALLRVLVTVPKTTWRSKQAIKALRLHMQPANLRSAWRLGANESELESNQTVCQAQPPSKSAMPASGDTAQLAASITSNISLRFALDGYAGLSNGTLGAFATWREIEDLPAD